jgi:hypothetical protein
MIFFTFGWGYGNATLTLGWRTLKFDFSEIKLLDVIELTLLPPKFGWLFIEIWLPFNDIFWLTWLLLNDFDYATIEDFNDVGLP